MLGAAASSEGDRRESVPRAESHRFASGWAPPRWPPRRAVGYRNAGTCEFLLDGDGDAARFYFLEMNTRLQVEHPGDRMRRRASTWFMRNCASRRVSRCPFRRTSLSQRGHAIECRIYAEDPAQGFLPQAGPSLLYREPQGPGIRVDSGVQGRLRGVGALRSDAGETDRARLDARGSAATRDHRVARLRDSRHPHQHSVPAADPRAPAIRRTRRSTRGSSIARAHDRWRPRFRRTSAGRHSRRIEHFAALGTCATAPQATAGTSGTDPFEALGGWRG